MNKSADTPQSAQMKNMVCQNKRCNHAVGFTDGYRLYLNGELVPYDPHYIAFDCPKCKRKIVWDRRKEK